MILVAENAGDNKHLEVCTCINDEVNNFSYELLHCSVGPDFFSGPIFMDFHVFNLNEELLLEYDENGANELECLPSGTSITNVIARDYGTNQITDIHS